MAKPVEPTDTKFDNSNYVAISPTIPILNRSPHWELPEK